MTSLRNHILSSAALLALIALSGCNSGTSAVESKETAKKTTQAAEAVEEAKEKDGEATLAAEAADEKENQLEVAKVINQPGKVKNRGGFIKILVNKQPITNFDIQRRAKFLQLRRVSGNRTKLAEQELIEQAIKLQEARARRVIATDQMVDTAFANFAKGNRATPSRMAGELNKLGVGSSHFKEFIRTQISWQRAVQGRFQAETNQVSEREATNILRKSGSAKPEVTEYNLQQVIFVVPQNKRTKALVNARRVEAVAFRQRFTSCPETIQLAKSLRDVSVLDRKRIMEPELPERWKADIPDLTKNGTTRPKETDRGIEIMAVCDKRTVNDDRAAQVTTQATEFASFNTKGSELADSYLKELVSRSTIVYR